MSEWQRHGLRVLLLAGWLMVHVAPSFALDNPDTPDIVGEFEARAAQIEGKAQSLATNTREIVDAYAEYEKFLDQELNKAYSALLQRLNVAGRQKLVVAQRRWLAFRAAEFSFIAGNWSMANFGSSAAISRAAMRNALTRERVVGLLHYLKNYDAAPS